MKYKLDNICIKKAKNGAEYVSATIENEDDIFDGGNKDYLKTEAFMSARMVKEYKKFLPPAKGGTATPDASGNFPELPERLQYFTNGKFETVPLVGGLYHRMYSSDFTDGAGVVHKAGELICDKAGRPQVFDSIRVLTKKVVDNETGELEFAEGWTPQARRAQSMAFFVLANQPEVAVPTDEAEILADSSAAPAF